jgi:hypothetical protein
MGNREALLRARTCLADEGHARATARDIRLPQSEPRRHQLHFRTTEALLNEASSRRSGSGAQQLAQILAKAARRNGGMLDTFEAVWNG